MADNPLWHETLHDHFGQYFSVDNVLYHEKTDHQDLIIFDNRAFGRVMALDGVVVSRHQNVETITMVEIDAGVVSFCRQYLPNHNAGAYDDPRFTLVIDDGVNFVNQTTQTFDVIISDCTDPIGPGESLFTSAFYEGCKRCLNPGGIFVAQNGVCFLQQDEALDSHRKLSTYFRDVSFYQAAIQTYYGGIMTFAWASDNEALRHLSSEIIQARFHKANLTCRYYNPAIHTAAFALPQYLHDALSAP